MGVESSWAGVHLHRCTQLEDALCFSYCTVVLNGLKLATARFLITLLGMRHRRRHSIVELTHLWFVRHVCWSVVVKPCALSNRSALVCKIRSHQWGWAEAVCVDICLIAKSGRVTLEIRKTIATVVCVLVAVKCEGLCWNNQFGTVITINTVSRELFLLTYDIVGNGKKSLIWLICYNLDWEIVWSRYNLIKLECSFYYVKLLKIFRISNFMVA